MKIKKGFFIGSIMYCVSYKGLTVFNRNLSKAIQYCLTGLN